MEKWMQPLSNAGIFLIALVGALIGKPFVREFATAGRPDEVSKSDLFTHITTLLTWIWIAAFAGMTVSSAIPPIVQGDATILDTKTPLSFVCYWVIPFAFMGLAALASRILPDKMTPSDDVVRETSFVAYSEAAIDELYYLAQEHANREVGAKLPRSSGDMYKVGQRVTPDQALPGDLIFYGPDGTQSVAMFLGNQQMLEVTDTVVAVSAVRAKDMTPYLVRVIA
jgi:hypothetical protein